MIKLVGDGLRSTPCPVNFPQFWAWLDGKQERRFRKWEALCERCPADWATCDLVRQIGNPTIHPEVQAILKVHDEATRAEFRLPLA